MIVNNVHGLPEPIVEAVRRDPYTKGKADWSVTELMDSPRASILRRRHQDEVEHDVSDFIWRLMGSAIHHVLERGGGKVGLGDYAEQRLFVEIDGFIVSGGMDLWLHDDTPEILDYKFTTAKAWGIPKIDWERQLNSYRYLLWKSKGVLAEKLTIIVLIRDWSKEIAKVRPSYPQAAMLPVDVPVWDLEDAEAYLRQRISVHASNIGADLFGEEPDPCTDEETWMRPDSWAVMKAGGKRASGVFRSQEAAEAHVSELLAKLPPKKANPQSYEVIHRHGQRVRCVSYCEASAFCSQFATYKELNDVDYQEADEDSGGD